MLSSILRMEVNKSSLSLRKKVRGVMTVNKSDLLYDNVVLVHQQLNRDEPTIRSHLQLDLHPPRYPCLLGS